MTLTMAPKARSAKGSVRMLVFDKGRVPNATGVVAKLTRYG